MRYNGLGIQIETEKLIKKDPCKKLTSVKSERLISVTYLIKSYYPAGRFIK